MPFRLVEAHAVPAERDAVPGPAVGGAALPCGLLRRCDGGRDARRGPVAEAGAVAHDDHVLGAGAADVDRAAGRDAPRVRRAVRVAGRRHEVGVHEADAVLFAASALAVAGELDRRALLRVDRAEVHRRPGVVPELDHDRVAAGRVRGGGDGGRGQRGGGRRRAGVGLGLHHLGVVAGARRVRLDRRRARVAVRAAVRDHRRLVADGAAGVRVGCCVRRRARVAVRATVVRGPRVGVGLGDVGALVGLVDHAVAVAVGVGAAVAVRVVGLGGGLAAAVVVVVGHAVAVAVAVGAARALRIRAFTPSDRGALVLLVGHVVAVEIALRREPARDRDGRVCGVHRRRLCRLRGAQGVVGGGGGVAEVPLRLALRAGEGGDPAVDVVQGGNDPPCHHHEGGENENAANGGYDLLHRKAPPHKKPESRWGRGLLSPDATRHHEQRTKPKLCGL